METINTQAEETSEIINAKNLLNWCESNSNLQVIKINTPIMNYFLNDIKIKNRMKEDSIFLNDKDIFQKIRRGNCIANYTLKDDTEIHHKIVRKGLVKFFDYLKTYKSKYQKEEQIVLSPIKKVLNMDKKPLVVYITEKANGENAQIAYEPVVDGWIIGSKNVTMVARNKDDIKWYLNNTETAKRFSYCAEFADLWFDILEKQIISKEKLDDFINDIMGYTLICENVGDLNHQHIKLYKEKNLVFYGMVKNDSLEISEPVHKSFEILHNKYGLEYVSVTKSPILHNYDEFTQYMTETYNEILRKDIKSGGEGSVAYFTQWDENQAEGKVVSMGKLKTFEYRFLRKLREKLNHFSKYKADIDQVLKKIQNECNDLLGEDGDELDLSEWLKFAKFVFNFVKNNIDNCYFADRYAIFINEMKDWYKKEKNENFVITDEIIQTVCNKYVIEQPSVDLKTFSEIENTKIKERIKLLNAFAKKPFKKGNVYFIISSVLVGGGKSTLFSMLEKIICNDYADLINLMFISSDKLKDAHIKEYMSNNPIVDFETAYDRVSKNFPKHFNNEVLSTLNSQRCEDKINICCIDKNFPGKEALDSFFKNMVAYDRKIGFEIYVLHPLIFNPIKEWCELKYPFSLTNFIQSYYRIKGREHENLCFSLNPTAHHILLGFLALYFNYNFNSNNNKIFFFPFTFSDEKEINFNKTVRMAFADLMKKIGRRGFDKEYMKTIEEDINYFFDLVEANYPSSLFEDTRNLMEKEMKEFLRAKVYGKIEEKEEEGMLIDG